MIGLLSILLVVSLGVNWSLYEQRRKEEKLSRYWADKYQKILDDVLRIANGG